jgi:hypothetical protein
VPAPESSIKVDEAPAPPVPPGPASPAAPATAPLLPALPLGPPATPLAERERLMVRGQRQRLAGILFTVAGVGLAIGSGVTFARCCERPTDTSNPVVNQMAIDEARMKIITGAVLAGSSLVALIAGLGFWSVGQYNINEARKVPSAPAGGVSLQPGPAGTLGAGLGWRF